MPCRSGRARTYHSCPKVPLIGQWGWDPEERGTEPAGSIPVPDLRPACLSVAVSKPTAPENPGIGPEAGGTPGPAPHMAERSPRS